MLLLVLFVCAVSLYLTQILAQQATSDVKYPNGPRPWPFLGNFITVYRLHRDPDQVLPRLAQQYGDVCMLWLGWWPMVVISSACAAHVLLQKEGAVTASRPQHNDLRASIGRGRLALTPAGAEFNMIRKIYRKMLSSQQSESSRDIQEQESVAFLGDLLDRPSNFMEAAERYALSIIFKATYGIRLATLNNPVVTELYDIWERLLRYVQPGTVLLPDTFPILLKLPTCLQPWHYIASNLKRRELAIHESFIARVEELADATVPPDCYGSTLLQWQKSNDVEKELVLGILAMLIGAGSDTSSTVLQNFFKIMALHSEVLTTAQKEIDAVVGRERLPSWEDEKQLPYTRALIKEVHRWAPIGSIGIPHATTEDLMYLGCLIPKGSIMLPNLVTLNRDIDRYSNPDIFDPQRHFGDELDASASAVQADYMKRDHFHYGFGRRLCLGIFMAEASLFISIARILWAFDIQAVPGHKLDMKDKIYGLTMKPKPFRISITCRNNNTEAIIRDELRKKSSSIEEFTSFCA